MKFLGINPFSLVMDNSKFIAMARVFNPKVIIISYDWAVKLYSKANKLGYRNIFGILLIMVIPGICI